MAISHRWVLIADGGYFYRLYPRNLFGDHETDCLHGYFIEKFRKKEDRIIKLKHEAEFTITDKLLSVKDSRVISSVMEIDVPQDVYDHPFICDMGYKITAKGAFLL